MKRREFMKLTAGLAGVATGLAPHVINICSSSIRCDPTATSTSY